MSDKEFKEIQKKLKEFGNEVTKTKESSQKFLMEVGIITENGNLKPNYQHLCTRPKQD